MTTLLFVLIGLVMGAVFGLALEKSRVFEPGMIVGQMQLRNFIMLKVFLAAVATGLVVLAVLTATGWASLHLKPLLLSADLVGGLLLGAGITLAGACPGTVVAQIGTGYRDALAALVGGLAGTMAYGYLQPSLAPFFKVENPVKLSLAEVFGVPFWLAALVAAALMVVAMILLERWRPWKGEMGADFDGDLSGSADKMPGGFGKGHAVPAE